jgi:hypothetical protein
MISPGVMDFTTAPATAPIGTSERPFFAIVIGCTISIRSYADRHQQKKKKLDD